MSQIHRLSKAQHSHPKSMLAAAALAMAFACMSGSTLAGAAAGSEEPTADADGVIAKKVGHRMASGSSLYNPFGSLNQAPINSLPTPGATTPMASPISNHGGVIMPTVSKIVIIWYGNWAQTGTAAKPATDTPAGQQIIRDALYGMAAAPTGAFSNYSGITTGAGTTAGASSGLGLYTQANGSFASKLSSTTLVEYTQAASSTYGNTTLTDKSVLALVTAKAKAAPDANAIYLVLSSSNIGESSGFLTRYCGWHTYNATNFGGTAVKYAFVGNPAKSLAACAVQTASSPNGNPAVDAMVSVIAHELEETVTDPQLNAWYDATGQENGDMCAWTFGGAQMPLSNGSYYNVTLPTSTGTTRPYLLQRALAVSNSKCYINATGNVQ